MEMKMKHRLSGAALLLAFLTTAQALAVGSNETTEATPVEAKCPDVCQCSQKTIGGSTEERFVIDCKEQGLQDIPDLSSFEGVSIYRIYLDLNELTSVPDGSFAGLTIQGIELADNPDLEQMSNASFEGLEKTLQYLSLKRTALDLSQASFLQNLPALRVLDLSEIGSFAVIGEQTFTSLPELEELDLSGNDVTEIADSTFIANELLTILKLDENDLEEIPRALRGAANLQELSMVSCSINSIEEDSLSGLRRLKTLKLSDNKLQNATVHSLAFADCGDSLTELNLEFNELEAIPTHFFKQLKELEVLKLNGNKFEKIETKSFSELSHLVELDLSENDNLAFTPGMFEGLPDLKTLKLTALGLTEVPSESLSPLKNLQELDLTSNDIISLSKSSFQGLSLKKLTMMYNGIRDVDSDAFESFEVPAQVILNNNLITDVSFLEDACRFSQVELVGNNVNCTCVLYGFSQSSMYDLTGECAFPENFAGTPLGDFPRDSMATCQAMNVTYDDSDDDCAWQRDTISAGSGTRDVHWLMIFSLVLAFPVFAHCRT